MAILSARETADTLTRSLAAVRAASAGADTTVDVLVNGNARLAEQTVRATEHETVAPNLTLRIWFVALSDKAHVWNEYVHRVWAGGDTTFFVDGYARVRPDALSAMHASLHAAPDVLAASGVPTVGRSARVLRERLLADGGIHGNLYALRGSVVTALRTRGFRLPLGLYRTDPVLAAVLCFNLDPARHEWNPSRIVVEPTATWEFAPLAWWKPRDLSTHLHRTLRQAQGTLETCAVREHLALARRPPEDLPRTAADLVRRWLGAHPWSAAALFARHPLCLLAAGKLRRQRNWSPVDVEPALLSRRSAVAA